MAIISLAQLQTIMVDTSLSLSSVTSDLANACISDAEAKVREMLSPRYDVSAAAFNTTTSAAPALIPITRWLAASYYYMNNSRGGEDALKHADRLEKKAIDNITKILAHEADLLDTAGAVIDDRSDTMQVLSNTTDYSETFGEDDPQTWAVDSDKLDDISDDRG